MSRGKEKLRRAYALKELVISSTRTPLSSDDTYPPPSTRRYLESQPCSPGGPAQSLEAVALNLQLRFVRQLKSVLRARALSRPVQRRIPHAAPGQTRHQGFKSAVGVPAAPSSMPPVPAWMAPSRAQPWEKAGRLSDLSSSLSVPEG